MTKEELMDTLVDMQHIKTASIEPTNGRVSIPAAIRQIEKIDSDTPLAIHHCRFKNGKAGVFIEINPP